MLITLIVLAIISMLAIASVRNASSSESVSGNVRLTELATQASELALRHCERSLLDSLTTSGGGASSYTTNFTANYINPPTDQTLSPPVANWQRADKWDSTDAITAYTSSFDGTPKSYTPVYILQLSRVNQASLNKTTYQRPPECMVEKLIVMLGGVTQPGQQTDSSSYLVTSRGFGPEVPAADAARSRPVGSEVWMQSQLIFNY